MTESRRGAADRADPAGGAAAVIYLLCASSLVKLQAKTEASLHI